MHKTPYIVDPHPGVNPALLAQDPSGYYTIQETERQRQLVGAAARRDQLLDFIRSTEADISAFRFQLSQIDDFLALKEEEDERAAANFRTAFPPHGYGLPTNDEPQALTAAKRRREEVTSHIDRLQQRVADYQGKLSQTEKSIKRLENIGGLCIPFSQPIHEVAGMPPY